MVKGVSEGGRAVVIICRPKTADIPEAAAMGFFACQIPHFGRAIAAACDQQGAIGAEANRVYPVVMAGLKGGYR